MAEWSLYKSHFLLSGVLGSYGLRVRSPSRSKAFPCASYKLAPERTKVVEKPVTCVGDDASQKDEQGEKGKKKTPPLGAGE